MYEAGCRRMGGDVASVVLVVLCTPTTRVWGKKGCAVLTCPFNTRMPLFSHRYIALSLIEHPDKRVANGSKYTEAEATKRMQLVSMAYETLSNTSSRQEYDAAYSATFYKQQAS